jgi:hypothetical protein
MRNYRGELRQELTADSPTSSPHLNDDVLAEIATAEALGENVETLYIAALQHLELCVDCADTYANLIEIFQDALNEMTTAASTVSPAAAYAAIIQHSATVPTESADAWAQLVKNVTDSLPAWFSSITAVTQANVTQVVDQLLQTQPFSQALILAARRAISHKLGALAAYLTGQADAGWQREFQVRITGRALQLTPAPARYVPVLGEAVVAEERILFKQRLARPLPVNVTARATRVSTLGCRVDMRIDSPGILDASGRTVHLIYSSQRTTAVTGANGVATFPLIPIAALENLVIDFQ